MNENMKQIALRVRELREILDMTTTEVAGLAGINEALYCDYENGNIEITVSDLYSIAAAFQIDPTALLTGETPKMGGYTIVRSGHGMDLERHQGYMFSSLAANYAGRDMEPMLVYLKTSTLPTISWTDGQKRSLTKKHCIGATTTARKNFSLFQT